MKLGEPHTAVQFSGLKRRHIIRCDTYHCVSLLILLKDKSVQEEVQNYGIRIRNDGCLEDFVMGQPSSVMSCFPQIPKPFK